MEKNTEQPCYETPIRVRYAETDQMGVVHHANYLVWFEVGRVELMRQLGFDYKRMESEDECQIVVVEASARYKLPARYDDELIVRTQVKMMRGFLLKFGYEVVRRADGRLLCNGETTHVVCDKNMQKRTLPEKYAERFRSLSLTSAERQAISINK